MSTTDRLEAYHFYERDWDDYDRLLEEFEWEVPETFNMATYVCDRWAEDEERVALFADDGDGGSETYTFRRVRNATNALANAMRDRGVERGDRIAINMRQRPETVIAHVACWKLGAVSVPLSTLFGTDAVSYRLNDADAVACFVDGTNVETVRSVATDSPSLETIVTVGDVDPEADEVAFRELVDAHSREFETVETDAEDDAIIIYTSGTTGDPKGVRHAHRVLLGNLPLVITGFCNMELHDSDVFWTPSEWAWVATLFDVVFPAMFYGRPVVAYSADEQFDPETAMGIIERYGVTVFFGPATALRMMEQMDDPDRWDVSSIRCLPSGGESLGQSIVEWARDVFDGAAVHEAYGQTEANMLVGDCTKLTEFREGKIGRRAPGHEIAIVDPETAEQTVETGDVGEIAVRYEGNPVCFKEYWNKPDKTGEKVRNGWLLTEDLGCLDEDGYLEFVSRKDSVIISAGYRIGPVEIEEALANTDAVADAGVIGVPDDERGEVPKAFVVLADGFEASEGLEESLRQDVRDRLAKYEYPQRIEFVDELPKTSSGKIRRTSLEEREGIL
ncbi:AMP-binding protein [Natrinema sp. 1APR25-10V2]|uniref:acyl-CoA synthetase n=1 Tax=Natrinema sp. 1APR25-10V2 TaxID=2951081 RepID=UPI002875703C|nr:AMP-binding protein [Natrinema sp. 1APR25-10V2]MDS0477030.1 AMP-binding protein [Natrinema sp. 1APR25-10V2]